MASICQIYKTREQLLNYLINNGKVDYLMNIGKDPHVIYTQKSTKHTTNKTASYLT